MSEETPLQEYIQELVALAIQANPPTIGRVVGHDIGCGIGREIIRGLSAKQLQSIGQEIGTIVADRILQSLKDDDSSEGMLTEEEIEQTVSRILDAAEKKRQRQVFLDDYS